MQKRFRDPPHLQFQSDYWLEVEILEEPPEVCYGRRRRSREAYATPSVPITAGHDFSNMPPLLPEAVDIKLCMDMRVGL